LKWCIIILTKRINFRNIVFEIRYTIWNL